MTALWRSTLAAAGLAVTLFAGSAAVAQSHPTLAQANELQAAGRAGEAYALLAPQAAQRAGDPAFDYALGVAAVDSGRPAEAIIALQRVLAVQPTNSQARAELARAYAVSGDIDTARQQFDTVVDDPSLPDPVRQRFNRLVRDYDRQIAGGGLDVTGFVEGQLGYDSNINAATAEDSITVPLFAFLGPAALTGPSREQDDGFAAVSGGLSLTQGVSRQGRVFLSGLGSVRENLDDDLFETATVTATSGYAHSFAGGSVVSLAGQVQEFWLGGDRYREGLGVVGQVTQPLGGGSALSVSAQVFDLDYRTDPLRDADRYSLGLSYFTRTAVATLSAGKEETDDELGDNLSFAFAGGSLAVERPTSARMSLVGAASVEVRSYDSADPLFLKKRDDIQVDVSAGAKVRVSPAAYLRPALTYTKNFSDIDLYEYDRVTASVALRYEF